MDKYIKLSELVGDTFTIKTVEGYVYKAWDEANRKFLTSETYQEGYSKKYPVITDKGKMELSSSQMSQLLEGVVRNGVADVLDKTFTVKSNGQTGKDIRYWLNPVSRPTVGLDPALKAKLEEKRDEPTYPSQPSVELPPVDQLDDEPDLSGITF